RRGGAGRVDGRVGRGAGAHPGSDVAEAASSVGTNRALSPAERRERMAVFISRPVRVEAVQWTGENEGELRAFAEGMKVYADRQWASVSNDERATFVEVGE